MGRGQVFAHGIFKPASWPVGGSAARARTDDDSVEPKLGSPDGEGNKDEGVIQILPNDSELYIQI